MKIAVLGLGFMGSTHLKALKNIPGAQVIAVVSDVEQQLTGDLSGIQGNVGGPGEKMDFSRMKKYRRPEEALRDPEIEAVDVCLPTHFHAPVAMEALRAGKHVLLEKPMALDGESADRVLGEARRQGRVLMVAHVLRFMPCYTVLVDALASGRLGPVRSALFRRRCAAPRWSGWLSDKAKSGGGVFDLLIHDADMCLKLFGAPEAVASRGCEDLGRGIDWVTASLDYPGIGGVVVSGGWHGPGEYPFSMEYTVVADGGTIEYSSAGRPPTLYHADGTVEPLAAGEKDGYQAEIEYFVECCEKGAAPAQCPPADSAKAVKLTRLIADGRASGGERIACNL